MKTSRTIGSKEAKRRTALHAKKPEIVLLAVTGISPAILTETIWALASEGMLPTRVIVLTTSVGSMRLEQDLFAANPDFQGRAVWDTLREALSERGHDVATRLLFEKREITRWNKRGIAEPIADIRSGEDSRAAADYILDQVRGLVETPRTQIIASIAGGRKTMGALLYAAMTLLGRETDRITHVLVQEPFDWALRPAFYFPAQPTQALLDREGGDHRAEEGRIELASIPFVPLRNLFKRDLIEKPSTFTALVQRCRCELDEVRRGDCQLLIRKSRCEIEVNGVRVKTSPLSILCSCFSPSWRKRAGHSMSTMTRATTCVNLH